MRCSAKSFVRDDVPDADARCPPHLQSLKPPCPLRRPRPLRLRPHSRRPVTPRLTKLGPCDRVARGLPKTAWWPAPATPAKHSPDAPRHIRAGPSSHWRQITGGANAKARVERGFTRHPDGILSGTTLGVLSGNIRGLGEAGWAYTGQRTAWVLPDNTQKAFVGQVQRLRLRRMEAKALA